MVMKLDASDDRGINSVREDIKGFAEKSNMFYTGVKLIILDEADAMTFDAQFALRKIIENKYPNILDINFDQKESQQNFWFISKNKEEPRLADRFEEHGSELEQPLAIARDIKKLYEFI